MYSLTIVGGGAVSCGYDDPNDKNIITHIHGALKHPKINLNSIIEIDNQRREYISNKWGKHIPIYLNINDTLKKHKSDIFVIATPTDQHFININEILTISILFGVCIFVSVLPSFLFLNRNYNNNE